MATVADSRRLHVGCGDDYREGWVNLDANADVSPDVVHDLADPWPFDAGEFDHVEARHVVEHLQNPVFFFREAARVLDVDGVLVVAVPIGVNAATDLSHAHEWTYATPEQFSRSHRRPWDADVPFELVDRDLRIWHEGPFCRLTPAIQFLADRRPGQWTSRWPASSGELIAHYRRCSE